MLVRSTRSLIVMARSTTYESAKVSLATFMCDVDECTFEGNCSKSLKRHKLTHSAALLHCDFMGCSFETKYSSSLKRHKLSHTTKVAAEKAIAKDTEAEKEDGIAALTVEQINTPSSNQITKFPPFTYLIN